GLLLFARPCRGPRTLGALCLIHSPPPPHIHTLSLHDALPILNVLLPAVAILGLVYAAILAAMGDEGSKARMVLVIIASVVGFLADRKSTRLNSSHGSISYAVFCLKKKREHQAASAAGTSTSGV